MVAVNAMVGGAGRRGGGGRCPLECGDDNFTVITILGEDRHRFLVDVFEDGLIDLLISKECVCAADCVSVRMRCCSEAHHAKEVLL